MTERQKDRKTNTDKQTERQKDRKRPERLKDQKEKDRKTRKTRKTDTDKQKDRQNFKFTFNVGHSEDKRFKLPLVKLMSNYKQEIFH